MAAHTPGPWEVVADHPQNACLKIQPVNRQYGGDEVATIYGVQDDCRCVDDVWTEQPIRDANARLIAAAPELLAACEAWVTYLDSDDELGSRDDEEVMMAAFRAAIAKARGR